MNLEPIYLLGAGASYGARGGDPKVSPPLGAELASYLLKFLGDRHPPFLDPEELEQTKSDLETAKECIGSKTGTEVLMESLLHSEVGPIHPRIERIHWLLMHAMSIDRAFEEKKDLFDTLFDSATRPGPAGIITLNYDLLTEEALSRCGYSFFYPHRTSGEDSVPVFKIHGSINFLMHRPPGGRRWEYVSDFRNTGITQTHDREFITKVMLPFEGGASLKKVPVMGIYARQKIPSANREALEKTCSAAVAHICKYRLNPVICIGVNLPADVEDDPPLLELFDRVEEGGRKRVYVSPDENMCKKFRARGWNTICGTFLDYSRMPIKRSYS